MDKITEYAELVESLLREQPDLPDIKDDGTLVETHAIFDRERHRYMIYRCGWWDQKRINTPLLYIRIAQNKIWIEEDWTEDGIVRDLLAAGVSKDDIVLGFRHPTLRPLTEFAIA